ncbi:MAG: MG2 domain-containing protein [Polyangia bacterium]
MTLGRSLLALLALPLLACHPRAIDQTQLHVLSFAPEKETQLPTPPVRILFSAPVASDTEVGKPLAQPPLTITPTVAFTAYYADRETLVAQPKEALRKGTRYTVALTGSIIGKQKETFSFVSSPLRFVAPLGQLDHAFASTTPRLFARFDQPVLAADVAKACALKSDAGTVALAVDSEPAEESVEQTASNTVVLKPARTLDADRMYALSCEGLMVPGGDVPLTGDVLDTFHTYGPLREFTHAPTGQDVAPNDAKITIQFSTPMDLDEVRKSIHIEPAAEAIHHGSLDAEQTTYTSVMDLEVGADYKVTVDGTLKDRFGQKLDKDLVFTFHTGDATPKISMETGIFAVEGSAEGYPVWSRNVNRMDVECAAVDRKAIVPLLTSSMNYDPWYDAGKDHVEWKKLGLHPKSIEVKTHGEKNKWALTQLQLPAQCGATKSGLYLAEVKSKEVPDEESSHTRRRVLANVTNLGLLLKAGSASGLVWVVGISDGKPVAGAAIEVFDTKGVSVFHGTSDGSGLLRLPGTSVLLKKKDVVASKEADEDWEGGGRDRRLIVVAEKDGDLAVVDGNWQNGIQVWNFGVQADSGAGDGGMRGFIQSDRGIYRPGETVHVKGLIRAMALGKPPHVPGGKVAVSIEDARENVVFTQSLTLSKFGGFWFDLPISPEANVGDWHVVATIEGQTFREQFSVQEFRKAEVEIRANGLVTEVPASRKLGWKLEADYLFGAPVVGAHVAWTVQSRNHALLFPRFPAFMFGDYSDSSSWWDRHSDNLELVSDGETTTDKHGVLRFHTEQDKPPEQPTDYVASVKVKDETGQTTSKQVVVVMHPSEFYLGLHTEEWVQAVAMPFAVNLVALAPDGKQVDATVKLSWLARHTSCPSSGGSYGYNDCKTTTDTLFSRDVKLSSSGVVTERIRPETPGEFEVLVEATDSKGHAVKSASSVYVIGKGEAFWSGDESDRVSLIASKQTYEPGDTAKIVARTNMPGATALVTLERNGVMDAYVSKLGGSGEGFSIPIKAEHAPNVFASVALVTGRSGVGDKLRPRFKMGVVDLQVSSESQHLKVVVTTDKSEYRPGTPLTGTVKVVDGAGKPVAAEVALSVADEGVLQVIGYQTPDPMKTFYAPWGLGVDTATTLNRISRLADPEAGDPDEGGDSAAASSGRIRSKFLSSAFWAPALVTDSNGEAKFGFSLPDNLTAFRLMAVVADKAARFGSSDLRVTVKKPLLLQPILPRFLTSGDEAQLGVVVHNYTSAGGTVVVEAHAEGVKLATSSATVNVPSQGSVPVRFVATAGFVADAKLMFSAKLGAEQDAVELTIPVTRGLVYEKTSLRDGEMSGHLELPVGWGKDDIASASSLQLTVDGSGMSELGPSLRSLIEYPYGCLEQTLSRFIPLTKVKELSESLDLPELRGDKLKAFIAAGAAKVVRHQHEDGHFSLWPDSQPQPYLTAYALWGLSEAKRAGVSIDANAVKRGLAALHTWVQSKDAQGAVGSRATIAMSAYVFADLGAADAALNARLYTERAQLPRYGAAFLLSALKLGRAPAEQIATLEKELLGELVVDGNGLVLREPASMREELLEYMSSDVRSTALLLRALLLVDPKNAANGKLAAGLLRSRVLGYSWESTQDNLYALVALSAYAKQRANTTVEVTVKLGDKTVLVKRRSAGIASVSIPLSKLEPGTLKVDSTGSAFVSATLVRAHRTDGNKAVDQGFSLTRVYLDAKTDVPLVRARPGQLVKVRVTATSTGDHHYVALVDRLPAGLEPVNPALADEERAPDDRDRYWWRNRWVQTELRDDRVQAFADEVSAGEVTLEYLARAAVSGSFTASPATIEEMYHPSVRGRTTSARFEVAK